MPERSCVVCNNKLDKVELIRLSIIDNELIFDLSQKIPSRGYYVCYDLKCIGKLTSRRKKIKTNFTFNQSENLERLKNNFTAYILKMLNIFFINNNVVVGVKDCILSSKELGYIITSSDISKSSLDNISKSIDDYKIIDYIDINKVNLGKTANKSYVVALGLKKVKDLNFKRVISQYKVLFSQE